MKKKESTLSVFSTLLMAGLALLCSSFPAAAESANKTIVWKVGTLAPKGIGWASLVETVLAPALAKATDNTLSFKIFFGGIMGDDESVIAKMDQGQLEGAGLSGQGAILLCRELSVLQLPYMFAGYDEVDFVRSRMTPVFEQALKRRGVQLLAWIDQDFDRIYSMEKPMARLSDFSGARVVCWSGFVERALIEKLGATPVVLDVPEISQAIRSRRADVNIGPAIWMVGTQLHGVFRYVVDQPVRYTPALIVVSDKAWTAVPEKYRERILELRPEITRDFCQGIRKDNERYLTAMVSYGVNRVVMAPENLRRMKEATSSIGHDLSGIQYPREILVELQEDLEAFRAARKK
ncbi:MAG: TRAP transporter substrate-binding protein DctP [Thermodesulfobacteriota bacterium]